jgi:hypothetical protein
MHLSLDFIAGDFGFFTLTQCGERPPRPCVGHIAAFRVAATKPKFIPANFFWNRLAAKPAAIAWDRKNDQGAPIAGLI